jgi:hypothetical protein
MAEKTLREFSAPSTENIRVGPTLTNNHEFELKPSLINMVQATMERHMKMLVLICRIFWRFAAPLLLRTLPKISYYFICFHSHWREERSNGSTPTKIISTHGQDVQKPSYKSFSQ